MNSLNIQSTILEIANLIGINNWQLVEGMYNGCSFTSLQPINSALAQTSIGQAVNDGIFAYNSIIGALGADVVSPSCELLYFSPPWSGLEAGLQERLNPTTNACGFCGFRTLRERDGSGVLPVPDRLVGRQPLVVERLHATIRK